MSSIRNRLSADLREAARRRDADALSILRSVLGIIDNAGAVPVAPISAMPMAGGIAGATEGVGSTEVSRRELSEEEIIDLIRREVDELAEAAELIGDHSCAQVERLAAQMEILKRYL